LKPPSELALKGPSVEEWTDVHFFRPLGIRVARALGPTGVTADEVTLAALALGLVAGHLVVYASVWLNLLGVAGLVASDVLDSADGQLARLRGTSTRFGRVLDGLSDMLRFLNLYVHLLVRMTHGLGWGWPAAALVALVIWSHSLQGAAVDFIKNVYLEIGEGRGGEADLPEDVAAGGLPRAARRLYAAYVREQVTLFPATYRMLQEVRRGGRDAALGAAWEERQAGLLPVLTLIATNVRFALLAGAVLAGHPVWFLYATVVPMNAVLAAVVVVHERRTRAVVRGLRGPVPEPAVAG